MTNLARSSIAARVVLGFAALAVIFVVHAVFSYGAADEALQGYARLVDSVRYDDRVQRLRVRAVELQRATEVATSTGDRSAIAHTRGQLRDLSAAIDELREGTGTEAQKELLSRLRRNVASYQEDFEFAVAGRALRDEVGAERLHELDERTDLLIARGDLTHSALGIIWSVRRNIFRYLIEPRDDLWKAAQLVASSNGRSPLAPQVEELLDDYLGAFSELVHVTHNYLFLAHVVLEGHAKRFDQEAQRFSALSDGRVESIVQGMRETSARVRASSLYVALLAVVLSTWFAVAFGLGIARPLRSITSTLGRLERGESGVVIPETNRPDEIGVLARAANVFQEQNERTEALLRETRELAVCLDMHKRELERSNDELKQFVHTASHDLKSPLVTGSGFLGMARELLEAGDGEAALSKMVKVEHAHRRMEQLLSDLLELSRVGRTDLKRSLLDVSSLVEATVSDLQARYPELQFSVAPLPKIVGNESRVLQVFENLLGNAVKYAGVRACVSIWAESDAEHVRFAISDDGPGISPEHHKKVFGLFERLGSVTEGTGVGLAVVARVMQFHDGRVFIDSKGDGTGTTFWLEFPRLKEEQRVA